MGQAKNMKASELTAVFMRAECIKSLLAFLDKVLSVLLERRAKSVMDSLLTALKFGVSFDWALLHIT